MRIEEIGFHRVAQVCFGGVERPVFVDFVPEAVAGDYVLVHVGFALSKIDEEEAKASFALMERLGFMEPLDEAEEVTQEDP